MKKLLLVLLAIALLAGMQTTGANAASDLGTKLKGRILLQVESKGEAWYVNPETAQRHSLGRPDDAFRVMRELGLGISNADFNAFNGYAPKRLSGKILLKVEDAGRAYYVNPVDLKMHYLGRPADAFRVMRELGLGIKNSDLDSIKATMAINFKTYENKKHGFSFKYPAYLGDVDITEDDIVSCPEFEELGQGNNLPAFNQIIRFSNKPKIGTGGSEMDFMIRVAKVKMDNPVICSKNINDFQKGMTTNFANRDFNVANKSELTSTYNTDAYTLYTLFSTKGSDLTVIQAFADFIPHAYTQESAEIEAASSNDPMSVITFVKSSKNAKTVRAYFADFDNIVSSIKLMQ